MRKREFTQLKHNRSRALEKYREALQKYGENHSITRHLKQMYEKLDDQHLHTF